MAVCSEVLHASSPWPQDFTKVSPRSLSHAVRKSAPVTPSRVHLLGVNEGFLSPRQLEQPLLASLYLSLSSKTPWGCLHHDPNVHGVGQRLEKENKERGTAQ